MIKVVVSNMSCGHCQLKIRAELESNGYLVDNINMDDNSILIDTNSENLAKVIGILDHINYMVDKKMSVLDIEERIFWNDKLSDDRIYSEFIKFLTKKEITVTGFDEENFGIILFCTNKEFFAVTQFVDELM